MTTKKVTDLTELTTTAAGDFLHIVDVSDTTDDPAGSSRKVKVSNLVPASSATGGGNQSYLSIATTGGTTTLTAPQAQNAHLDVTGALTSDAVIVFPAGTPLKCSVANKTTNASPNVNSNLGYVSGFNVKLQVAGQANFVYVTPGLSKEVYSEGTMLAADDSDGSGAMLTLSYLDWAGTQFVTNVDQTATFQNFLLYCQLEALKLKAHVLDDQVQRACVRAYVPRGTTSVACPIVVPELVDLYHEGDLYRNGATGTVTGNYTGDTTTRALANLQQPTLLIPPGAHCSKVSIYCNPDGVHQGSGMYVGKNWTVRSGTIGSPGTGYNVGDVIYLKNPSKAPYSSFGVNVTNVNGSGGVTGISLNGGGAYALPPALQQQQWTAANNFNIFDNGGNFLMASTTGSGTGATIGAVWDTDWTAGTTAYYGGNGGLVQDTVIDHVRVIAAGTSTDATYGPQVGFAVFGLNFNIGEVEVNGGYHSFLFNRAVDVRADRLNAVSGVNLMTIVSGGDINCADVVLDTPFGGAFLNVDSTSNHVLKGQMFNNGSGSVGSAAAVMIGANSGGVPVTGVSLEFGMQNCGTSGGIPALSIAHTDACKLDFRVTNEVYTGATDALPNSAFAAFGTGVGASNDIRGSIDNVSGAILTGTIPLTGIRVWDGAAKGYAGPGGVYEMFGSGAPTGGTGGTGVNKAAKGSTYTDVAGGVIYLNGTAAGSPTWAQLGAGGLAAVATSGAYSDLTGKPTLGTAAALAAGAANGAATLDSGGKVPSAQLPSAIVNGLEFAGLWNASTNTPTLTSGTGTQGTMYKVSVSGTTNLNGISQWNAGDFVLFDGTGWDKIDGLASEVLSVAGRTGAVTLTNTDIGGLGTAAAQNVGAFAQTTNNLSDLASVSTALTNLLPSQSGNSGKVLSTNGTAATWANATSGGSNGVGALTMNVLSDSQGAQSIYQPGDLSITNIQTWNAGQSYIANEIVKYNGYLFYNPGSTATSGSTAPTPAVPSDGTITWSIMPPTVNKFGNSILSWVEMLSEGRIAWNMKDGYAGTNLGLVKVIVVNGGSGYTSPTITPINGVKATVQQSGGVITGVTIQSPGRATGYFTLTISDPNGSGAVLSTVGDPSGTFGVSGCYLADMIARLPDVMASTVDVMLVLFPTNDLTANTSYATLIAGLKTIFDTIAAGKKGLVFEVGTPRTSLNQAQVQMLNRVNRWARLYFQGKRDAGYNTNGYTNIALSDPTGYLTDGTPSNTVLNYPIGGATQSAGAMTADGLHPSQRGAPYRAACIIDAASIFFPKAPAYPARSYTSADCYDPTLNPGGNRLEAMPWTASTAIIVGQSRANNGNVYFCTTAGTTASSGGPSGTGTSITDGSAVWTYAFPQFMSVLGSGSGGTIANPGGSTSFTISGVVQTGVYLSRASGGTSTAGTITGAIESPWSNGQVGQRQSLVFSLGGGAASEAFQYRIGYLNYNQLGILASDLGVTPFTFDTEVELTGVANMTQCYPSMIGPNGAVAQNGPALTGVGNHIPNSSGEMITFPTKLFIKTPPLVFPANTTVIGLYLNFGFDGSGAANSATGTIKINKIGFQQYGVA